MKTKFKKVATMMITGLIFSTGAFAQDKDPEKKQDKSNSTFPLPSKVETVEGQQRHFGLMMGASDPVDGDYKASGTMAIEVGYQPYIPYGAAIELLTEDFESEQTDFTLTRTQLSLKTSYNFGGDMPVIRHSYIGLGLGVVNESRNDTSPTYGIMYPHLGFDIPLSSAEKFVSLGVNFRYTASTSNEADSTSLNGVVKYWF